MKKVIYILIFLLSALSVYSQKLDKNYHLKHTIRQDNEQFEFNVLDFDANGVYNYDKDKFYYWLKAQKVNSTQGYSSGLLLNGEFQSFYLNKQLSKRGYFHKGLKNGEWLYWNEEGILIHIEHWKSGVKCGVEKSFNEKGELLSTIKYKLNKLEYRTKDSLIVQKLKKAEKSITTFDAKNKKIKTVRLKHDELNGKQESYKDGKIDKVEYYEAGKIVEKSSFSDKFKKDPKAEKSNDKSSKTVKKDSKSDEKSKKDTQNKSKKKFSLFSKEKKTSK